MENLAPIILFVYNRPQHTERTLNALAANKEAKESVLYVYCDGAKATCTSEQLEKIKKVRQIVKQENRFKRVTVMEREENMGLASSIIEGVYEILKDHDKIIVLEDDLATSQYFLSFMNEALTVYKSDGKVACISGYIYPVKENLPETFFLKGADCWGWATWKRAWSVFEEDGRKLLSELESKSLTRAFDFEGSYPYTQMLKDQIKGKNSSWAIRWYASAFVNNMYCLYPGRSLVQNIGIDGSGTHSGVSNRWDVDLSKAKIHVKPIPIQEDNNSKSIIIKYFKTIRKNSRLSFKKIINKLFYPRLGSITFQRMYEEVLQKLKNIIPNSVFALYRDIFFPSKKHGWFGNYSTWAEAKAECTGYDAAIILEKVKASTLKVKKGEAVYERDSVVFNKLEYSQALLDAFTSIAKQNNEMLSIVDFGGSLGSSYFQNKTFMTHLNSLQWNVVEQAHFVACGRQFIEDDQLKFYDTIEGALKENRANVLYLSNVIQYLEKPYELIEKCLNFEIEYIIIDRTAFVDSSNERITVQIVPESIYKASYPTWFFNEQKFLIAFKDKYKILNGFLSNIEKPINIDKQTRAYWKGFLLKRVK